MERQTNNNSVKRINIAPGSGAKPVQRNGQRLSIWLLRLFLACGVLALVYYFSWWLEDGRIFSPVWFFVLLAAVIYSSVQMVGNWYLYLAAHLPALPPQTPKNLTVDVFVTVCGEPHDLIERSLRAAVRMNGAHETWLLDDGSDPVLAALAKRLGAGYFTRQERKHAKAGNLNAAVERTEAEILVIFDIDHAPERDFLERTLGFFNDPQVGFIQVMLTFKNGQDSWVAQAAAETSLEFYNPTSLGTHGIGGATMMGSNALIRRAALNSIGGYQPGLAEDLATSINLHAAGWRSVYVAEPLAPGIAPPDLGAWFTQQLKWARGVFELLLMAYPRLFPRLTWGQRISYAVRMTKYWIGPAVGLHLFATIFVLILANAAVRDAFHEYLLHLAPLAFCDVLIRQQALRAWRHQATPRTSLLRAVILVYATWPIYMLAWFMALLRLPLAFRPTPKRASGWLNPVWLLPQVIAVFSIMLGIIYTVVKLGHPLSVLLTFALVQAVLQLLLLARWLAFEFYPPEAIRKFVNSRIQTAENPEQKVREETLLSRE